MQFNPLQKKFKIREIDQDSDHDYKEQNRFKKKCYKISPEKGSYLVNSSIIKESSAHAPNQSHKKGLQKFGKWTIREQINFLKAIREHGKNWEKIKRIVQTRSGIQLRSHFQKLCSKIKIFFNVKDAILFIQSRKVSILELVEIINRDVYGENEMITQTYIRIDISKIENSIIFHLLSILWEVKDVFLNNQEIQKTYSILYKLLRLIHNLRRIKSRHIQHFSIRVKKFIRWLLHSKKIFTSFYKQFDLNSDLAPIEIIKEKEIIGSSFKMNPNKVGKVQSFLSYIYFQSPFNFNSNSRKIKKD